MGGPSLRSRQPWRSKGRKTRKGGCDRKKPSLWLFALILASHNSSGHAFFLPDTLRKLKQRIRPQLESGVEEEIDESIRKIPWYAQREFVLRDGKHIVHNGSTIPGHNGEQVNKKQESRGMTAALMSQRRNARSVDEGILREKAQSDREEKTSKLSALLAKASAIETQQGRRYAARTITGLIHALAEEVSDLEVLVDARENTPIWNKHIDAIRINFSRLGFKPLQMGGLNPLNNTAIEVSYNESEETPFSQHFSELLSADEAFARIDTDQSGALDRDEIAYALNLATGEEFEDMELMKGLATDLLELYDFNGDGVVDRAEYQSMVEDMAALRDAQKEHQREIKAKSEETKSESWFVSIKNFVRGMLRFRNDGQGVAEEKHQKAQTSREVIQLENLEGEVFLKANGSQEIINVSDDPNVMDSVVKTLGSITLSDLRMDLRRLIFGAVPIIKRITPGGPLILEPFTCTVEGSFNREDIMNSFLLDEGLRRLVARAIRGRVRLVRDFIDGAVFHGRSWKDLGSSKSPSAPVVEVPELTNIEFDSQDRLILTGIAKIRTRSDAPQIENLFKVRTKIGARKNGQVIRLVEPELAFVFECPRFCERAIESACSYLKIKAPPRPEPIYSFFPIYSPFNIDDDDGFDLGEDNCIKSIFIKGGALGFELSAVLRPGRFLGNHYIAFSIPSRTFIITLDRVKEGVRAARREKKAAQLRTQDVMKNDTLIQVDDIQRDDIIDPKRKDTQPKSFFSRFVDGYFQADREDENERIKKAISDFFGRQGENETSTSSVEKKIWDPKSRQQTTKQSR